MYLNYKKNKSSAVAEMGDRTFRHSRHGPKRHGPKSGAAVPLSAGYNFAWAEAYLRTKWHLDPFNRLATILQRYRQDRQDNGPVA